MILAQPQELRRDRLADLALLRRLSAYTTRTTLAKLVSVAVALGVAAASDRAWLPWLALVPVLIGITLHLLAVLVTRRGTGTVGLRQYEAHLTGLEGQPALNLPAVAECCGGIFLVVGAAWTVGDLSGVSRLSYLAAAASYLCLVSSSIFDESSWYNPAVRSPSWQEINRYLCGLQMAAVLLLIAWWAPWTPTEKAGVAVVASWSIVVWLRVGATQYLLQDLEQLVEQERQVGTRFVIEETRRSLLPPLVEIRQLAAGLGDVARPVLEHAQRAIDGIQDIPNQVAHSVRHGQGETLETVAERLVTLSDAAAAELTVQLPSAVDLREADRATASLAMRDLVGNAVSAGAARVTLTVRKLGPRMLVAVTDDAPPMPTGAWKSPGTSSAALEARLAALSGSLSVDSAATSKTVTATWMVTT
jgi:signal transduction histidine kinase